MIKLKGINEFNPEGKKIFVRLDLDIPFSEGQIKDDSRLKAGLETLSLLLDRQGKVIIAGHLGRPKRVEEKYSLKPVADWYAKQYLSTAVKEKIGEFDGWRIKENLVVLENLRFFPEEEKNDPEFCQKLALLADVYINDAFAVSHRAHASTVGIAKLLPHYAGIRLQKEISVLSQVLENPKRPLTVIVGGVKIETKLPLVKKMNLFADTILVGGAIALEFEKLLEENKVDLIEKRANLIIANLTEDKKDITIESAMEFVKEINKSATIVWNGLLGVVEEGKEEGTKEVIGGIINSSNYSIAGGGDTVGYLQKINLLDKFSFVSTGGGAMLEFLAGEKLPAIEVLLT